VPGIIPTNHYTGVPEITIPLFQIELDGLTLPLTLNYNASGIRVSQESSWVGLGWSLNAGGIITRSVQGLPDISSQPPSTAYMGYPWVDNFQYFFTRSAHLLNSDPLYHKSKEFLQFQDGEPDIFYFNMAGYTGKMLLSNFQELGHNMEATVNTLDHYLDMKYDFFTGSWTAIDGKGFKYYFGSKELTTATQSVPMYVNFDSLQTRFINSFPPKYNGISYSPKFIETTSAWMLDSIVSPLGNRVEFEYRDETIQGISTLSETYRDFYYDQTNDESGFNPPLNSLFPRNSLIFHASRIKQKILYEIRFPNGRINFFSTDRKDLQSTSTVPPKRLQKIEVRDLSNSLIKKAQLLHSYMGDTISNYTCRLMLESIVINSEESYSFDYVRSELPPKHSLDTDHWGYYNGPHTMQRGHDFYSVPGFETEYNGRRQVFSGRNKDGVFTYMKYGSLKSIQYPTGAKSEFLFEPHNVSTTISTPSTSLGNKTGIALLFDDADLDDPSPNPDRDDDIIMEDFVIPVGSGPGILKYFVSKDLSWNSRNADKATYFIIKIQKKDDGGVYQNYPAINSGGEYYSQIQTLTAIGTQRKQMEFVTASLPQGDYRLVVIKGNQYSNYYDLSVQLLTRESSTNTSTINLVGPGLRVKSIESSDGGKLTKKTYKYFSPHLMVHPKYYRNVTELKEIQYGWTYNPSTKTYTRNSLYDIEQTVHFFEASSHSFVPFTYSAKGSLVGYDSVIEYEGDETVNNGYTYYQFHNVPDEEYEGGHYVTVPIISDTRNGLLKSKEVYDSRKVLLYEEDYDYEAKASVLFPALHKIQRFKPTEDYYRVSDYQVLPYHQQLDVWRLYSLRKTTYTGGKTEQYYTYKYDNNYFIKTEEEFVDSQGDEVRQIFRYPFNSNDNISVIMTSRNMVEVPIEVKKLINNNLVDGKKFEFKSFSQRLLPSIMYKAVLDETRLNSGVTWDKKEEVLSYDLFGKIREFKKIGGVVVTYLWGYNGQYPVAKIENATYVEVENILGSATINSFNATNVSDATITDAMARLRNDPKMANAQVTSYTYKPLVGMTSMTDPRGITEYYQYDGFQRLKDVLDFDKNLLQNYQYHYRP